jgi:hypothetical protein
MGVEFLALLGGGIYHIPPRTSENSVMAKFAEFPFQTLG